MKKILSLALVVMFVLSIATIGFADVIYTRGPDSRVLTYTLSKTATVTLSSTVGTNNRILGYAYTDSAAGTGAIWDASVATSVLGNSSYADYLISEISVAAGTSSTIMFPLPRNVVRGLVVNMTTTTGCITVYYE